MKLERSLLAGLLFAASAVACGAAWAAPAILLSTAAGPPTTTITVSGTGFAPGALVDIYFDTTNLCLKFSDGQGKVSCAIKAPKQAQPQTHWITAVQRNTATGAQKRFVVRTDWAQFHGRNAAHTGYNAFENTLNKQNVADLDTLWRASIGSSGSMSTPVVWGSRVFIGGLDGKLYSFSTQTGAAIPGFPKILGGEVRHSSPAVGYGNVYVATAGTDAKLYAFNAATGAPTAGFPITLGGAVFASPTLYGGNVYVAGGDGKIYAFNAATGASIPGFPVVAHSVFGHRAIYAAVSIANDRIFVGQEYGGLYAFDSATGVLISGYPKALGAITGTAAIVNGQVFQTSGNRLHALRLSTGAVLPGFPVSPLYVHASSPAVGDGHAIVGSWDHNVRSYSPATGALQWSTRLSTTIDSSPVIANGVVYVNSWQGDGYEGGLYALDASTGAILWRTPMSTEQLASPTVADGIVFIGSTDGYLYAFSVDGVAPSAHLKGGARGVRPALTSLRPDRTLRPTRN